MIVMEKRRGVVRQYLNRRPAHVLWGLGVTEQHACEEKWAVCLCSYEVDLMILTHSGKICRTVPYLMRQIKPV